MTFGRNPRPLKQVPSTLEPYLYFFFAFGETLPYDGGDGGDMDLLLEQNVMHKVVHKGPMYYAVATSLRI